MGLDRQEEFQWNSQLIRFKKLEKGLPQVWIEIYLTFFSRSSLFGYPIDGVILTTGCDKTTPAALMAAATVNIPAIVLSGGPMLDGSYKGKKVGSGTIVWEARKLHAKGEITV